MIEPPPPSGDPLRADDLAVDPDGSLRFTFSPILAAHYEPAKAVLWSVWTPRAVPCFPVELLHDLERGSRLVEHYFAARPHLPLTHVVLRSGVPGVFSLGGDLGYFLRLIETGNRARLTEYARSAINVAYRNHIAHNLPGATMVALLEGDALGGGLESALSCDFIVAEAQVKAGFPEVLFDMFPGMGGLTFLHRRARHPATQELARTGRLYEAEELLQMGVIDMVVDKGGGAKAVEQLLRQRARQPAAHSVLTSLGRERSPVSRPELAATVRRWVDHALALSARGREWMTRLHDHQLLTYGKRYIAELAARSALPHG